MDNFGTAQRAWSRTEIAKLLISHTALTQLRMEHALQVVRLLTPHHIKAGDVLIREGVTSTGYMALVLHGEAVVENGLGGHENDTMVLSTLGTGSLFGEMGVLDGKPRSATVTAHTDMHIAVLDRPGLARLIDTVPAVACALMGALMARVAERLRATNAKLAKASLENQVLREQLALLRQNPTSLPIG